MFPGCSTYGMMLLALDFAYEVNLYVTAHVFIHSLQLYTFSSLRK
jgi:hypothetical protein